MKQDSVTETRGFANLPFTIVNDDGAAPALIICDHASRHIPEELEDLGLSEEQLSRHIAWDIGAGEVAGRLATLLDAPAVLCGTSRLVVDCNRPFGEASSIPESSDGVAVPGNAKLALSERQRRMDRYFHPYHDEIDRRIHGHDQQSQAPALISVHSFTPEMDGFQRPWHVGVLWDQDQRMATPVIRELRRNPDLLVGENEPYNGTNPPGYALHIHAADNNLPIAVFEIRQDLIDTAEGAERWAHILAQALTPALKRHLTRVSA
ncbi:MAG: N-formylglutamate amidohydrolase [Alphaproteobacteria bacterium]|jgi:predicted N-formylglutamate amidohydrolase|nr:N-formylglutamate amidohydrolase [Alphaproteobacteria bacterium]MDP7227245.1 N-formylglutamate amidohydrolase [Alphaproteobacteria bacterium]MDP7461362.1 N-formylglutamate amidohydrolase [Alphaproteobacteria bacterium]HJM91181.1 N-formylglutamate amidohydrolase [Alphaproteobacteria bacterium]|tara:strand:- start:15777 stop:16568 length:792 start_codon:yes stop_codon:yes gene_type:complete